MIVKNLLLHMYSDQMHNYYGALNIIYCTEEVGVAGILYLLTRRNSTRIYVCKLFSSSSSSRYVFPLQWWCAILQASKKLLEVGDCFRLLLPATATGYRGNYCNAQPLTPPTSARHWLLVLVSNDITVRCEHGIDGGYDGGRCKQPHLESWG